MRQINLVEGKVVAPEEFERRIGKRRKKWTRQIKRDNRRSHALCATGHDC